MQKPVSITKQDFPSLGTASLGIALASLCFGFVPFFSRSLTDQGMAPHAVAFYRYASAALLLMPLLYVHSHKWRSLAWGISTGVVMGVGWVGYAHALKTAPVSTLGVLYMTYPVFTLVIAWLLFSDRPSARAVFAAILIIIAAVLASSPAAVSADQLPALLISLGAPFGFGFGISVLVHRLSDIPPLAKIASVSLGSVIGLVPLLITSTMDQIVPQSQYDWFLIIGIGVITAIFPQLIYTVCAPVVGAARTSIIGSIELPTMFFIGMFLFGESVTLTQYVACAIVLGAIAFSGSRVTKNVSVNIAQE